jgi:Ca2+-binding EF-hand superfamily protein
MRSLGHNPSDRELTSMITEFDKNLSGKIEFHEFEGAFEPGFAHRRTRADQRLVVFARTAMMSNGKLDVNSKEHADQLLQSFKVFDRDGDGWASRCFDFRAVSSADSFFAGVVDTSAPAS